MAKLLITSKYNEKLKGWDKLPELQDAFYIGGVNAGSIKKGLGNIVNKDTIIYYLLDIDSAGSKAFNSIKERYKYTNKVQNVVIKDCKDINEHLLKNIKQ